MLHPAAIARLGAPYAAVFAADPRTNPEATLIHEVTYLDVLNRGLKAMDSTAITLCMDNALPIVMFDLLGRGNIRTIVEGGSIGTLVREPQDLP